jgi:hypothetical protein
MEAQDVLGLDARRVGCRSRALFEDLTYRLIGKTGHVNRAAA